MRAYDNVRVVLKGLRARWTFMGEVLIVAVCDVAGRAQAMEVLDHSGTLIVILFYDELVCWPINRIKSFPIPIELAL